MVSTFRRGWRGEWTTEPENLDPGERRNEAGGDGRRRDQGQEGRLQESTRAGKTTFAPMSSLL